MQKINHALIVSDFDGTLVKADGTISEKTRESIHKYVENGGMFAISTGRMPSGILSRIRELGLRGIVCCGQGSAIVEIESGKVLLEGNIPNDVAVKICKKMERMGLHIHVYTLWDYYSNMDDEALEMYERVVNAKAVLIQDQPISKFVKESKMSPCKVLAMVEPKDNERVCSLLKQENFEGCEVVRSSVYLVEVSNAQYTKGTSIEFLADAYNVSLQKTIAVGDQINDLSMIEKAGLGIAVKNADEYVKTRAVVCDYTNEEDAIAHIIEEYGYCK